MDELDKFYLSFYFSIWFRLCLWLKFVRNSLIVAFCTPPHIYDITTQVTYSLRNNVLDTQFLKFRVDVSVNNVSPSQVGSKNNVDKKTRRVDSN